MPSVVLYGRRWHTATDTIPFPAFFGAVTHAVWIIVFGWLISVYDIWTTPCHGQGVHYKVVSGGLAAIYGMSFIVEAVLTVLGMRGAPLELKKRQSMIPLLYVLSWLWLLQFMFTVYGTIMLQYASPLCYPGLANQGHVRNVTRTMIYTTWAFTAAIAITMSVTYNSYGTTRKSKTRNWEGRMKCLSGLMGCSEAMTGAQKSHDQDRNDKPDAPLPGIAQLVAGLFESIDLSPSDVTAALILAAASQQQRRKMRIKRALEPKLAEVGRGSVTSDNMDTASEASSDTETALSSIDEDDESDEDADAHPESQAQNKTEARKERIRESGAANGELTEGGDNVALPSNYPKEWANKAAAAYQGAGIEMASRQADSSMHRPSTQTEAADEQETLTQDDIEAAAHQGAPTAGSRERDVAESAPSNGSPRKRPRERRSMSSSGSSGAKTVALSEVDPWELRRMSADEGGRPFNVQRERFGLPQDPPEGDQGRDGPERALAEQGGLPSLETKSITAETDPGVMEGDEEAAMGGKLQASLTEDAGGLPPPSELSVATKDSNIGSVLGSLVSAFKSQGPVEEEEPEAIQLEVPIEQQLDAHFASVLTPSGQTVEVTGADIAHAEVTADYLGDRNLVPYQVLQEASTYARYSCGVYGVVPLSPGTKANYCGCGSPPVTETTIRENTLALSGIEDEDLIFYSHSNEALSHLPYMVALERARKTVVLAIRGTSSLADVVTDAVVRPAPVDEWLPEHYKTQMTRQQRRRCFAHAGIVAATSAILEDLKVNGMLSRLLRHETERKADEQRAEEAGVQGQQSSAQSAGTIMQELLDKQDWKLIVTGHSLGAGAAALLTLQLKDRYPDLKCWAFSPPGGLVSRSLLKIMEQWTTSIVVGKDAVPRASVNNLSRLMDEMVTALARCKYHKLRLLAGAWWRKDNRPAPEHLFCSYSRIPPECHALLTRYFKSREVKGRAMDMFPPGRIVFVRPIKQLDEHGRKAGPKQWDTVWIEPTEIIGEGILISPRMLTDHLIEATVMRALEYAITHHPANPQSTSEKRKSLEETEQRARLAEIVIQDPSHNQAAANNLTAP